MHFWQELERLKAENDTSRTEMRPFVTAAFAVSSDGYITGTRGRGTPLSGPEAMRMTHQLRASHDALLVGVGTVLSDDPLLTTRLVAGPSPLRVVLDSQLRVPATARLLHSTSQPAWVITTVRAPAPRALALEAAGAALLRVSDCYEGVSLPEMLARLYEAGVRSLMLEGGAAVLESFFRARCVDYVALTISPQTLANPQAVALGGTTAQALKRWRASHRGHLGQDRIQAGPWLRRRATRAGAATTATRSVS